MQFRRIALGLLLPILLASLCIAADPLRDGFASLPDSARPMTWWHWMQGNVSREGITADLESMKQAGLGGALIFHVGQLPIEGDVKFMDDQWWQLMRFAADEAARLDLRLGFHNCPGWSASGGPWVKVEQSMQKVVFSEITVQGPAKFLGVLPQPKAVRNYYRDIAVLAMPAGEAAPLESIIDLTATIDATGKLNWSIPAGNWKLYRIGHTTTGQGNHPAPPGGQGLECDKMSREALAAHYAAYPAKILANAGPHAGRTLNMIEIDSYEANDQNWTPLMRDEFQKRRGYDLTKWLPALNGQIIASKDQTQRFLYDMKRTVAELYAQNYYGAMRDLVHQTPGMQFAVEPYGGPFTTPETGAPGDIVMGEFWQKPNGWYHISPIASVAHVNGKTIVAAEAFTGQPHSSAWRQDPYSLKATGDRAFALGVNLMVLHTSAHQPWMNATPGMTMGWWGTHFGRTQTWWPKAGPWVQYLTRSQYLLQQGHFVADVLQVDHEQSLDGYRTDTCGEHDLFRLSVKDGRLTLPDGMSYAVLELPNLQEIRPEVLRQIRNLVRAGATIVGPRPARSPSLQNYPACDNEVEAIAAEIWDDATRSPARTAREALDALHISLDVQILDPSAKSSIQWLHRRTASADIYFVSNQNDTGLTATLSFRTAGRTPELWHADTGRSETAALWKQADGRTEVTLNLTRSDSVFVVFSQATQAANPPISIASAGQPVAYRTVLPGGFTVYKATYGVLADPSKCVDVTAILSRRIPQGNVRADNTLAGDPAPMVVKELRLYYSIPEQDHSLTVPEGQYVIIPGTRSVDPSAELVAITTSPEAFRLRAWQNGVFDVTRASGATQTLRVTDLPEPQPIGQSWLVQFPPNLGAPESITLQNLMPLNEHPTPGVRYFSGTATYRTRFTIAPERLAAGNQLHLDLGDVANLVDVRLNGKPLGILWKPPFRVDVTSALKAGDNELVVEVTNLWPNRMIGDEQEPDDCTWGDVQTWSGGGPPVPAGRPLLKVPDWLKTGKPRPSAGRVTFTAYKFYEKDSPLLRSGLIGPVRLVASKDVPLAR